MSWHASNCRTRAFSWKAIRGKNNDDENDTMIAICRAKQIGTEPQIETTKDTEMKPGSRWGIIGSNASYIVTGHGSFLKKIFVHPQWPQSNPTNDNSSYGQDI